MLTNTTATLTDLQALVNGSEVVLWRAAAPEHGVGRAPLRLVGTITSAFEGQLVRGLGVMFRGDGFHTAVALPREVAWSVTPQPTDHDIDRDREAQVYAEEDPAWALDPYSSQRLDVRGSA